VGWDGEGRERKGEEGRDGKRAGGKYCFMAVGGMDATAQTRPRNCGKLIDIMKTTKGKLNFTLPTNLLTDNINFVATT
jgi:hypothetical protein